MYKSEFCDELFGNPRKFIMDPVHGSIPFFEHEGHVVNHALFQRLRFIGQTDVTSFVFPGATHTRFQHSLGTMHVAGKLFQHIMHSNLADERSNRRPPLSPEQVKSLQFFFICIRLAALLHDLGHFPFSHLFEHAEKIKGILHSENLFGRLWSECEWKHYYAEAPRELSHEHYSVRCAHQVLQDIIGNNGPMSVKTIDVLGIMEGTNCLPSDEFTKASKEVLSIFQPDTSLHPPDASDIAKIFQHFFKTLISGELDVDKMDYLLRDSFYSGCKYGIYNLDHLLSTIRLGALENPPWLGLAIVEKGIGALEDFIYSRFQLYQNVYSHKVVCGFKWLLTQALDDLHINKEQLAETEAFLTDIDNFKDFTDGYFWEGFRHYANDNNDSAARWLLTRKKLDWLYSERNANEITKNATKHRIKQEIGSVCIHYDTSVKFSRLREYSYSDIQVLVSDPFNKGKRSLRQLNHMTNFFEKFSKVAVTHYYKEPF